MAIQLGGNAASVLIRSNSTPSRASGATFFFRLRPITALGPNGVYFSVDDASNWSQLWAGSAGNVLELSSPNGVAGTAPTLTLNAWIDVAMVIAADNSVATYIRPTTTGGSFTAGQTGSLPSWGPAWDVFFGGSGFGENAPCEVTHARVWERVLTLSELATEAASPTPVSTTSLWADWRLASTATMLADSSGNGRSLTSGGGTFTTTTDPTLPGSAATGAIAATTSAVAVAAGGPAGGSPVGTVNVTTSAVAAAAATPVARGAVAATTSAVAALSSEPYASAYVADLPAAPNGRDYRLTVMGSTNRGFLQDALGARNLFAVVYAGQAQGSGETANQYFVAVSSNRGQSWSLIASAGGRADEPALDPDNTLVWPEAAQDSAGKVHFLTEDGGFLYSRIALTRDGSGNINGWTWEAQRRAMPAYNNGGFTDIRGHLEVVRDGNAVERLLCVFVDNPSSTTIRHRLCAMVTTPAAALAPTLATHWCKLTSTVATNAFDVLGAWSATSATDAAAFTNFTNQTGFLGGHSWQPTAGQTSSNGAIHAVLGGIWFGDQNSLNGHAYRWRLTASGSVWVNDATQSGGILASGDGSRRPCISAGNATPGAFYVPYWSAGGAPLVAKIAADGTITADAFPGFQAATVGRCGYSSISVSPDDAQAWALVFSSGNTGGGHTYVAKHWRAGGWVKTQDFTANWVDIEPDVWTPCRNLRGGVVGGSFSGNDYDPPHRLQTFAFFSTDYVDPSDTLTVAVAASTSAAAVVAASPRATGAAAASTSASAAVAASPRATGAVAAATSASASAQATSSNGATVAASTSASVSAQASPRATGAVAATTSASAAGTATSGSGAAVTATTSATATAAASPVARASGAGTTSAAAAAAAAPRVTAAVAASTSASAAASSAPVAPATAAVAAQTGASAAILAAPVLVAVVSATTSASGPPPYTVTPPVARGASRARIPPTQTKVRHG